MKRRIVAGMCVAIAGLQLCGSTTANATAVLTIDDSAGHVKIVRDTDNDGIVSYNSRFDGPVGNWRAVLSTGLTKPTLGSALNSSIDMVFVDVRSAAGGTLKISWWNDAFTGMGTAVARVSGRVDRDGSLKYETFYNDAATSLIELNFISGPFSGEASASLGSTTPYSLKQVITITHGGSGVTWGDATFALAVPDGGVMAMLLGFVLIGIEGLNRKFKSMKK